MRVLKNPKTLEAVIRAALARELTKMQDSEIYGADRPRRINDWGGEVLASWVAPGVIASVKRHLTLTGKPSGQKDRRKPAGL